MIQIVESPISITEVVQSVADPSAGGIDVFIGTTRNNASGKEVVSLHYESYTEMALKSMEKIAYDTRKRWEVKKISIVHRIGKVDIGEASVVIAVSSEHRKEAFEACRYIIDELKRNVPIWKKEIFHDGEVWIGSQDGIPGSEKA